MLITGFSGLRKRPELAVGGRACTVPGRSSRVYQATHEESASRWRDYGGPILQRGWRRRQVCPHDLQSFLARAQLVGRVGPAGKLRELGRQSACSLGGLPFWHHLAEEAGFDCAERIADPRLDDGWPAESTVKQQIPRRSVASAKGRIDMRAHFAEDETDRFIAQYRIKTWEQ